MLQIVATRQVIAFEAQGHGRTADIVDREITYETMADDAASLLVTTVPGDRIRKP